MTVKRATKCGGYAAIVARHKLHNANQQLDPLTINKIPPTYNIIVGFNEKDHLQLLTKENKDGDDEKQKLITDHKTTKHENVPIDDINNCVNIENFPHCENTLVFYITKNLNKEAVAIKFENEQDFKRIYFTYKYFKMRNRLTNNANNYSSTENLFPKKKTYDLFNNRKNSIEGYLYDKRTDLDLLQNIDNEGIYSNLPQKNLNARFDQPLSLITIRHEDETDRVIYKDIEIPSKPEKRRLFHKKPKAPPPPVQNNNLNNKALKSGFIRLNVDRSPDVIPKDNKVSKVPDILTFREPKARRNSPTRNLWSTSNKVTNSGYESDREEWRNSRSQFSTTAFDSLARPAKMALTLRKPRLDPVPHYYRLSEPKLTPFRPNNFLPRPPRAPRPIPDTKRNLTTDHRKFTSLQNLELAKKLSEPKKIEPKKTNYSNLTHKITGLTNKLRDLGSTGNTLGRFKAQSHSDVANLKPVLKTGLDGSKRSVLRTCSAEPPKKVTFSAFATVQVV